MPSSFFDFNILDDFLAAWRQAAADLGVRIESPFTVSASGVEFIFPFHLPDFGAPSGMVCGVFSDPDDLHDPDGPSCSFFVAEQAGFWCSVISRRSYEHYDRAHFVEALTDWGYYGPASSRP